MRHCTIPIFVPHLGCPCQCSFCNQKTITGVRPMTPDDARRQIEKHLSTIPSDAEVEIAFFGGSFTAIPRTEMEALLQIAFPYVASGLVSSIRVSTRPDAIDSDILTLLSRYGVKTVELGIQSASDRVLSACRRGHTADVSRQAAEMIVSRGFVLGGQMMIGLPSSTPANEIETARAIVAMGAKEARIYPVVVFADTPLARDSASGLYTPLTVEDAVDRTVAPMEILLDAGVKLLRVGLCETESLHKPGQVVGGACHPALGELCYSALYRKRMSAEIAKLALSEHSNLKISVAPGKLSIAIGQKRCNYTAIQDEFALAFLKIAEDPALTGLSVRADLLPKEKGS
ncbi:MAG: radical SAM protein [Clostridia bacterium]|nr:radical SAM protein [Clostridia bacterium]